MARSGKTTPLRTPPAQQARQPAPSVPLPARRPTEPGPAQLAQHALPVRGQIRGDRAPPPPPPPPPPPKPRASPGLPWSVAGPSEPAQPPPPAPQQPGQRGAGRKPPRSPDCGHPLQPPAVAPTQMTPGQPRHGRSRQRVAPQPPPPPQPRLPCVRPGLTAGPPPARPLPVRRTRWPGRARAACPSAGSEGGHQPASNAPRSRRCSCAGRACRHGRTPAASAPPRCGGSDVVGKECFE